MGRTAIGGLLGGLALYLVGFIFWGTPLSGIAFARAGEAQSAAVQNALAQNLTQSGTGTYMIPNPGTQQGTTLFGQGPIATIHFNTGGFAALDSSSLIAGLILALVAGVLIAFALRVIGNRVVSFGERARVVVLTALAITLYIDLGQPVFNHYGWGYFVYGFVADFLGFVACGLVISRWFLPRNSMSA